jgi:hypothetical protein
LSNIGSDPAYDPFPKGGLVKQYEPFIRKWVTEFCEQFPHLNHMDALSEAVLAANKAADRFKPELRHDFSTLLRHYLTKLYAMQEEEKGWSHEAPLDWASDAEKSPQVAFPAGGNGTRIIFDMWKFDRDDMRKGILVALRLNDNAEGYARGVADRISVSLRGLVVRSRSGMAPKSQIQGQRQ